ncbi:MAG: hypothetical protein RR091_11925 [Cloacibacillus sp.]
MRRKQERKNTGRGFHLGPLHLAFQVDLFIFSCYHFPSKTHKALSIDVRYKMDKSILVGNGININFGGAAYTNGKIIERLTNNLTIDGKYTGVFDNSVSQSEIAGVVFGLNDVFRKMMKSGVIALRRTEGEDEMRTLIDISRRYHGKPQDVLDIGMEDYFFVMKWFNNGYGDSTELSQAGFDGLKWLFLDSIYNGGDIESLYQRMGKFSSALQKYNSVYTVNYDTNLDKLVRAGEKVYHLHGNFEELDDTYKTDTVIGYVAQHKPNPPTVIPAFRHIYCNAIMGYSGAYKLNRMMIYEKSNWAMEDMIGRLQNQSDDEAQKKYKQLMHSNDEKEVNTAAFISARLEHPELRNTEYPIKEFSAVSGQLDILGMSPNNDTHILNMINENPNIKRVVFFYAGSNDMIAAQKAIKKPLQLRSVFKYWDSLK